MKYEIVIRELEPYTKEEEKELRESNRSSFEYPSHRYADTMFHERRALYAELTPEEFQAVKKAVIDIF